MEREAWGLQFMGSQKIGHNLVTEHVYTHTHSFNLAAVFVGFCYIQLRLDAN